MQQKMEDTAELPGQWKRLFHWERGRLKRCWTNSETSGLVQIHRVPSYPNEKRYVVSFGGFEMESLSDPFETLPDAVQFARDWIQDNPGSVPPDLEGMV